MTSRRWRATKLFSRCGCPAALAEALKARAAEEHVPTSALIRRILARAVREGPELLPLLTVAHVEEIARRIVRESA
ncbi:MAG: ribbon-helix-helix protein, CopG family [Pseudonocardiaceae bacterium]